jgi:hypothetical protein
MDRKIQPNVLPQWIERACCICDQINAVNTLEPGNAATEDEYQKLLGRNSCSLHGLLETFSQRSQGLAVLYTPSADFKIQCQMQIELLC